MNVSLGLIKYIRLISSLDAVNNVFFACMRMLYVGSMFFLVVVVVIVAAVAPAAALLDRTVEFLLARSAAADKAVRLRCCQLLGGMMTEYSQRLHVQEEEIDRVVDVLLPRLQDKASGDCGSNSSSWYCRSGPSLVSVEQCRLPAVVPVRSPGTDEMITD